MYQIECHKEFDLQLDIPLFGERFQKLFKAGKKKVVYFKDEFDNSTFRYRCTNFIEAMENSEKYEITYFLCKEIILVLPYLKNIDLIILQRAFWMPEFESLVHLAHGMNIPVIYDMDDLFFKPSDAVNYINHIGYSYTKENVQLLFGAAVGYQYAARNSDAFIATVPVLAKELEKHFNKPSFIIPNFINREQIEESEYVVKNRQYSDERFHIGYFSGSSSHLIDLRTIENELIALMKKYKNIDLVIVGLMDLPDRLKQLQQRGRVIFRDFVPYQELQYEIGRVDVNIAPLISDDFNEAKSELKFFEAGIVKVPSCVTSTEIYRSVIRDGENGFVCKEGEWFSKLERLYLDAELRRSMAEEAYRTAVELYAPQKLAGLIGDTYDRLLEIRPIEIGNT